MTKILMTISGGGFMWQSNAVLQSLIDEFDISIIVPYDTVGIIEKLNLNEKPGKDKIHHVHSIGTVSSNNIKDVIKRLIDTYKECRSILATTNPDYVICVASSIAVPLFIAAKLKKKQTIYIDSITRVEKPSLTGKILDRLHLCNKFYVQWPELDDKYRSSIYKGTII